MAQLRKQRRPRKPRRTSLREKQQIARLIKSQPDPLKPTFAIVLKRNSAPPFTFLRDQVSNPGTEPHTRSLADAFTWHDRTGPFKFLQKHPTLKRDYKPVRL